MGLFDRFGAGGGKLELQPNATSLSPGQVLDGRVVFTGGSRSQAITHIKLKLSSTQMHMENTPQGPQQRSRSTDVAPEILISGPLTTQPSQRYEFPFSIQLPAQMISSAPNVCTYHLGASADIDNEIDPGAGTAIQIVGGMMAGQPMMGGMPGQPMMAAAGGAMGAMGAMAGAMMGQGGMMQPGMQPQMMQPGMQPQMMQPQMMQPQMMQPQMMQPQMMQPQMMQPQMMQPQMMQQPMMGGAIGVGSQVLAQWQDGQFHPGVVVQLQNGYYAVDWTNPQLGATTWVAPQQLQMNMGAQPMGMPGQPMAQPMKEMKHAGYQPGSAVLAQSADGNWNAAKLVSMQNGYYAVDWENDKLGPTAWVSEAQIRPR